MEAGHVLRGLGVSLLLFVVLGFSAGLGAAPAGALPCSYTHTCPTITTSSGGVTPGGSITLSGSNYHPASSMVVNVCGLEKLTVRTSPSGRFVITVSIPGNAPQKTCVITTTSATTTVVISKTPPVPPTSTGEPWAAAGYWLGTGAIALLGLGLLVLGQRRRRVATP